MAKANWPMASRPSGFRLPTSSRGASRSVRLRRSMRSASAPGKELASSGIGSVEAVERRVKDHPFGHFGMKLDEIAHQKRRRVIADFETGVGDGRSDPHRAKDRMQERAPVGYWPRVQLAAACGGTEGVATAAFASESAFGDVSSIAFPRTKNLSIYTTNFSPCHCSAPSAAISSRRAAACPAGKR